VKEFEGMGIETRFDIPCEEAKGRKLKGGVKEKIYLQYTKDVEYSQACLICQFGARMHKKCWGQ
jgi:hypothetical protein